MAREPRIHVHKHQKWTLGHVGRSRTALVSVRAPYISPHDTKRKGASRTSVDLQLGALSCSAPQQTSDVVARKADASVPIGVKGEREELAGAAG